MCYLYNVLLHKKEIHLLRMWEFQRLPVHGAMNITFPNQTMQTFETSRTNNEGHR